MQLDHSLDYLTWDDTVSLVVTLQRPQPVVVNVPIALKEDRSRQDAIEAGLGLDQQLATFHIPDALFNIGGASNIFKRDDLLQTPDGQVWMVLTTGYSDVQRHWTLNASPQRAGK